MWISRSSNKVKFRNVMSEAGRIRDELGDDVFAKLCDEHVVQVVRVEDGLDTGEYCVLFPIGVEMIKILYEDPEIPDELDADNLQKLVTRAKEIFENKARIALKNRVQMSLLSVDAVGAKPAVFALFLLVCGAVSRDTALILREDENREIQFQEDLVDYLNELTQMVFKDSYLNRGKQFSVGDLSNFIRRNKEIVARFGDVFRREGELVYFDLRDERGMLDLDRLSAVVEKVVSSLESRCQENDDDPMDVFPEIVQTYMIASPIKQTHRKVLFANDIEFGYYYQLKEVIGELIENS